VWSGAIQDGRLLAQDEIFKSQHRTIGSAAFVSRTKKDSVFRHDS
jgi:hypothetical protein